MKPSILHFTTAEGHHSIPATGLESDFENDTVLVSNNGIPTNIIDMCNVVDRRIDVTPMTPPPMAPLIESEPNGRPTPRGLRELQQAVAKVMRSGVVRPYSNDNCAAWLFMLLAPCSMLHAAASAAVRVYEVHEVSEQASPLLVCGFFAGMVLSMIAVVAVLRAHTKAEEERHVWSAHQPLEPATTTRIIPANEYRMPSKTKSLAELHALRKTLSFGQPPYTITARPNRIA